MSFRLLLPLPVIAFIAIATAIWSVQRWRTAERRRISVVRITGIVALLLFIALDPAVDGGKVAALRSDADVLFVVDTTGSMAAEDYDGDRQRFEGVRADIMALVDEFPGAHFALVTFDTSERIVVPWTTDVGAFESAVSLLRQERTMYARGSLLDRPIDAMARLLPRSDDGSRYSVAFLLGDGEQTAEGDPPDFRSLDSSIDDGAVLGYGTTDGGRMRIYTERDSQLDQYIQDPETGEDAISRIDEDMLHVDRRRPRRASTSIGRAPAASTTSPPGSPTTLNATGPAIVRATAGCTGSPRSASWRWSCGSSR